MGTNLGTIIDCLDLNTERFLDFITEDEFERLLFEMCRKYPLTPLLVLSVFLKMGYDGEREIPSSRFREYYDILVKVRTPSSDKKMQKIIDAINENMETT